MDDKMNSTKKQDSYSNDEESFVEINLLDTYLNDISRFKRLTLEEERELVKKIKQGDVNARNIFIEANLKLVVSISKSYINQGLPLLDLIEEGNFGLMTAVEKFNPNLGYKFSTYADYWIRQSIMTSIQNKGRIIRIPINGNVLYLKIKKYINEIYLKTGKEPTDDEIAIALNVKKERVADLKFNFQDMVSLDSKVSEDEDTIFADFIADPSSVEEVIIENLEKEYIKKILNCLTEREKTILLMRFGFIDNKEYSLREIENKLNISRETIRKIESKTLRKLRYSFKEEYNKH